MRRLRHLEPFLVLLSVLLAASQLTSATIVKDAFIDLEMDHLVNLKEVKNLSALVDNDDDLSMDPSSQTAQIIRGNPFHSNPSSSPYKFGCDFRTKTCQGWDGIATNRWYWVRPSYNQIKKDGPVYDYYDSNSYPLQVNFTGFSSTKFNLTSPQFSTTGVSCFTFNYYFLIDATRRNELDVVLSDQTRTNNTLIWSMAGVDIDGWRRAEAQIDQRGSYKIILSAYASLGFIAVKNFALTNGPCPSNLCTFENGQCGFKTPSTGGNAFALSYGYYTLGQNQDDHTTRSRYGHVMYAHMRNVGDTVTLTSPQLSHLQAQCLRFFFLRGGPGVSLRVYEYHTISTRFAPSLWVSNDTHLSNEWIRVQLNLLITDPVTVNFEAKKTDASFTKIEIDDVSLTPFQCDPPITCSFQNDLCGWQEETAKSSLLWSLGIGRVNDPTKLRSQTPLIPYRNVLYTDFTKINSQGSMELLSEFVDAPLLGACVTFYYRVVSMSLDTDSFQLTQIDLSGSRHVLWSFTDSTKIGYWAWRPVTVFVPKTPSITAYRLSLSAKSANAGTYLGVRNLAYTTTDLGVCGHATPTSKPTTTTPTTTVSPAKTLNCDFERGTLCNWRSSSSDFTVTSPYSSRIKGQFFPYTDHTTLSRQGKVAYAVGDHRDYHESSSMTADNPFPNSRLCFSFYYYFYANGPSNFFLTMDRRDNSGNTRHVPVFSGFGGNEDIWRQAIFTIIPNDTYSTFTFKASLQSAVIVIDDIVVRQGECLSTQLENGGKVCEFEQNKTCIFEPIFDGQPTWAVYNASTFGIVDHTTHTRDGHYYGLDLSVFGSRSPGATFKQSTVAARAVDGTTYRCLQFSYLMANVLPNTTLGYTIRSGIGFARRYERWEVAGSTLKMWFTRRVPLPNYRSTGLTFAISTLGEPAGKVFIDDVKFLKTSCNYPHTCDFESGDICNMGMIDQSRSQLSSSRSAYLAASPNGTALTVLYLTDYADQIWHVFTPRQSTSFVQYDNTIRNQYGHYLLLTADDPSDRGMMVTEKYNLVENGGKICLSFAVYKPSAQSVLEVYQGESFNETHGTKIWSITRTTNSRWETFEILAYPLQKASLDLFFYFVGTLNDKSTYLGLDDVTIKQTCSNPSNVLPTSTLPPGVTTPTPDPNLYFTCKNGRRISADLTCNYVDNCNDNSDESYTVCGSCDFSRHNWCRYTQTRFSGDFSFRFRDTINVGPRSGSDDNSNFLVASGHYGSALIRTPTIHQSYLLCSFMFYYYYASSEPTNNLSTTAMKVFIERTDLGTSVLLWESSFERRANGSWRSVTVPVRRVRHPFRLSLYAYQSSSNPAKVHAIDDVRMRSCEPPTPSSSGSCSSSYLRCGNNVCVLRRYMCDFEDDCGNGDDERNCPANSMTSFESGMGLWGRGVNRNWKIFYSSLFRTLRDAPTYDHSTEQAGRYLCAWAEKYTGRNESKTAEIDSPAFFAGSGCQIRYYVFKNSRDSTLLAILQNVYTGQRYELEEIGSYDYKWVRHSSYVYRDATPNALFRVLFTATLNTTSNQFVTPYIAIDDISFTPECSIQTGPVVMPTLPNHSTMTTPKPNHCPGLWCISPHGHTTCLAASDLCDFYQDCKDLSDEQNCGNCTFDNGSMCEWKNYETRNPWQIVKPAYLSAGAFPKRDASGSSYGGFLAVKMLTFMNVVPISRLQSPRINGRTASTCKLQFSYFSSRGSSLSVRRLRYGVVYSLFSTRAATVTGWHSYQVDVGANSAYFNLEFYGSSPYRFSTFEDMAIDNIQLLYCDPHKTYPTPPPSAGSINCSFEDGLCGWSVTGPQQQRSNWLRTSSPYKEPGNDADSLKYPKPSSYGTWMTTQSTSNSFVPGKDYLISTVRLAGSTTYCFSFWTYFMSINRYSFFALYASKTNKASSTPDTDADYTALWRTNMPLNRNWNKKYVEISPQSNSFYLLFIAAVDSSGIVGLDSTELVPGKCPIVSTEFCDFEINNCDWKLASNGFQRNPNSVRFRDHTTGTTSGHFLQDTSTGNTAVMTKQMSSLPIFNNSNSNVRVQYFCLQFYYYMSTDFVDSTMEDSTSMLSVKIRRYNTNNYVTTRNISIVDTYNEGQLKTWALFQQSFYSYNRGNIEIDALQAKSMTQLLIDDISVTQHYCQTLGNCDFEFDSCGWTNMQTSSFGNRVLWLRIQPNSRYIKGTLLHYDHTTQSNRGNYLVMPAMMMAGSYSVLRSPLLRENQYPTVCFSMYYFARGANTSVIALTLRMLDLGKRKSTFVYINATTSLYWKKAEFEFNKVPATFAFQIEGSFIRGISSDIGIDDIRITAGQCSSRTLPTTTTAVPPSEKRLDCTFDSGSCNWKYDSSNWKSGRFSTLGNNYAPYRDHSQMTTTGQYLLFQASSASTSQSTTYYTISSTLNITYDKDHCLTMWYFEDGESAFGVDVYMVMPRYNIVANRFSSAIENRRRWNLLKADIQYNPGYRTNTIGLQIRYSPATNRLKQFSIFALDDIKVRPGKCAHQHDYVYTLAAGIEDLELEYIQPLTSSVGEVYTPAFDPLAGAPPVDHTTETSKGSYFLFMNRYTRAPTTYIVTLAMTDIPRGSFSTYSCVRFAYQVLGNSTLKMYVAPNNAFSTFYQHRSPVWQSQYSKDVWTIGEINIRVLYEYKVVFYMEKQPDKTSFIALDDLSLLSHRCQTPIDCDFDGGRICSYSPLVDKTANPMAFNWGLFTPPAQDQNWPGPRVDHTGTSIYDGGYLYLSAYHSVGAFSSAIVSKIVSGPRTVNPSQKYCLSLWTVISTKDLGLKLSLLKYGPNWADSNRTTIIASKSNTAESTWTRMAVPIDQTMLVGTYELQLVIEGTIGVNSKGGIFIDDILLMEGACQQTNLVCEDGTPIKPEQICNFVKDCKSGLDELNCGTALCNFETNSCGWGNMTTYQQRWLLTSASQARVANRNAPSFDGDANRSGHYLMVSNAAFGTFSNAETALNFPNPGMYLKNSYQSCVMQFDYYISSPKLTDRSYSLSVRIGRDRTDWSTVYYIAQAWSLNGWSKAYAHIGERNSQFMADIVGHLDNSRTSAMAVDNIQFVNCSMPAPLGPNQQCPAGQFMCRKYRFCVSNDALCNYKNDCGDGSDEIGCYRYNRCDFEHSYLTCHIKTDDMEAHHPLGINVEWNIRRGRYTSQLGDVYDPQIDSTLRTGSGHYLALETLRLGRNLKQTFTSEFYSPMMTSTANGNACRMRFFYFINGEPVTISATHLDIYIRYANKRTVEPKSILNLRLNINGDLQQRWNFVATQFTSTAPFQFVFRGVLGTNRSRIAVDDISFDPSGCQASVVNPVTPTTTGQPVTGQSGWTDGTPVTVTPKPGVHRQSPHSNTGGKVAAGILIPLLLVLGAIGGYFAYQKYQNRPRGDEHITLSMKNIQDEEE